MIDSNKIKGRMRELGWTQDSIASELGIDPSTFNKKLNERNGACFTVNEAGILGDRLNWDQFEKAQYFFVRKLA